MRDTRDTNNGTLFLIVSVSLDLEDNSSAHIFMRKLGKDRHFCCLSYFLVAGLEEKIFSLILLYTL
jgi:hypothetical protein